MLYNMEWGGSEQEVKEKKGKGFKDTGSRKVTC